MSDAPPPAGSRPRMSLLGAASLVTLLLIALFARMQGIGAPPLDAHHVRQSDTASIAKIMARDGIDLFQPRIGWAGAQAGTVESELPLYSAATALGWLATGATAGLPVVPRVIAVLSWLAGGVALGVMLARRVPGVPLALSLLLYALSPLGILFSRSIQPDALAIALLLVGLERADAASDRGSRGSAALVLSGALLGLAVACKGTLAFWLPLGAALALARGRAFVRFALIGAFALALAIPTAWYVHAHLHLGSDGASFKIWGADAAKWGSPAVWFDVATWRYVLGTFVSHAATPLGCVAAAVGFMEARRRPELRPFALGLVLGAVAVVVATQGFALHSYYQLALVPFVSVLAGAGLHAAFTSAQGWRPPFQLAAAGLAFALAALSLYQGQLFVRRGLEQDERIAVVAASAVAVLPAGVATVVVDVHPQTLLYAIDRQGWHRQSLDLADLYELETWGAEALLVTDQSPSWSDPEFFGALRGLRPMVARGQGWALFRLQMRERATEP